MKELFDNTFINSKLVSKDEKNRLIQYLKVEGLIYTRKSKNISGLNCAKKHNDDRLKLIFENLETIFDGNSVLEYLEKYDINRNYKYSAVFRIKEYDKIKDNIETLLSTEIENIDNLVDVESFKPYLNESYPDLLTIENETEYAVLKLNYRISNINRTMAIKFPVLCVLYKNIGIIEIRLTGLNNQFKNKDNVYKHYIDSAIRELTNTLKFEIEHINFRNISKSILEEKRENVTIYSQWMEGDFGSHARLRVAEDSYLLPILGQLETYIEKNEVLKENEDAKKAIRDFIKKVNDEHDFVRRAICWLNFENNIDYVIDFIHEYKGSQYTVLQNYFNNHDMEEMNDVTRNIISYEKKPRKTE